MALQMLAFLGRKCPKNVLRKTWLTTTTFRSPGQAHHSRSEKAGLHCKACVRRQLEGVSELTLHATSTETMYGTDEKKLFSTKPSAGVKSLANYNCASQRQSYIRMLVPSTSSGDIGLIKRHRSDDSKDSTDLDEDILTPYRKIEKQLMTFMDLWEMKKAIKLLQLAVQNNIIPHQTVILNLLQQLANLGEVDFLVDMHQFLLDEKLVSHTSFYTSLQQAYFNSGRIDEGIDFLRKIYHLTRKYQDVDTYFVLLTVMILTHFPDKECMVTQIVKDLGERVPEDHEVRAALWKCYMLTENFDKGEQLVDKFANEMKPFLPIMVNDIIVQRNKVDANRVSVLRHLLDLPDLSRKQRALLYHTCLSQLVEEGQYRVGLEVLDKARTENIALKADQVLPLLNVLEMAAPSVESESYRVMLDCVKEWICPS